MAKLLLHRQALELRKLGKSYNQIRQEIGVSKSTLSGWLKKYPLSKYQIRQLRDINEVRIEKYRQAMRLKKEKKLEGYYKQAEKIFLPLSKRDLLIAGLFLYWGEGGKTEPGLLTVSNTDPTVLQFVLMWMIDGLGIAKERIKVLLHLYKDMSIEEEINYWSGVLNIPKSQFIKPYIKASNKSQLDEKGYGHGTCNLRVSDTKIKESIRMGIKVISDYSKEKIGKNLI